MNSNSSQQNKQDTKSLYDTVDLNQQVTRLILRWQRGQYKTLEDIWLNMQELQFRIGIRDQALCRRLNQAMRDVADALWHKYQNK